MPFACYSINLHHITFTWNDQIVSFARTCEDRTLGMRKMSFVPFSAVTCTGRERTWGTGSVKRDPGRTVRGIYKKKNEQKRQYFDPRPTAYAGSSVTQEEVHKFIYELQQAEVGCGIQQGCQSQMPLEYADFKVDDDLEDILVDQCSQFSANLRKIARTDPFLVPGSGDQANSEEWRRYRCLLFTASIAHRVLGLSSIESKTNFVREHLWLTAVFAGNRATRYGTKHEPIARRTYLGCRRTSDLTVSVRETGLWVKREYPMLGCSPDGIVTSEREPTRLVEIKCPIVLEKCAPWNFDAHLTKKQLRTFPLERKDGEIKLKRSHSHFYQVQMQMDIMKTPSCDYVVWSPQGIYIINVPYEEEYWAPKRLELVCKHMSLLAPEYFLMRIPRDLRLFELDGED